MPFKAFLSPPSQLVFHVEYSHRCNEAKLNIIRRHCIKFKESNNEIFQPL